MAVPPSAVTYIKRMRLPLLAATIGMVFILLLDLFIIDTRPVTREDRAAIQAQEAEEDKIDRKDLLFSQAAWDSVQDTDDWDAIFDSVAWSSLLNEGQVGANVKDEPTLPPLRLKPSSGAKEGGEREETPKVVIPRDGAMAAVAAVKPVVPVIPAAALVPPSEILKGKASSKFKKMKSKKTVSAPPEELEKFEAVEIKTPGIDENSEEDWWYAAYRKSATYGMTKVFVEDEPLYKSCASDVVVQRQWSETFLTLGPFRYMGRSKNPCWYPDGGKFTCIPYFFLAGAAGQASADVMQKIMIHPDVIGEKMQINWWDLGRHEGKSWDWYRDQFQAEVDKILLDINQYKSSNKIFGDSTSTYFASPTGWERLSGNENCQEPRITLASHLRRLRVKGLILVILPHPTRRLLAEYRSSPLLKGKINPKQFHDDVQDAIAKYKECFSTYSLRQCAYNKTVADSVKLSLHEGMYSVYMEDWMRIFPPEQFLTIRFEDYVKDLIATVKSIYTFLALLIKLSDLTTGNLFFPLHDYDAKQYEQSIAQMTWLDAPVEETTLAMVADPSSKEFRELVRNHNPGTFLPESIRLLNEFYEPFMQNLADITGNAKFTWKDT